MPSIPSCTFRALFDTKSPSPKAVEALFAALKLGKAQRSSGWLHSLCKDKNEESSFVYLRAVLASQLNEDKELQEALEHAWGSNAISFQPSKLFLHHLEPQPVSNVVNEVMKDPIDYMQKVLADERKEVGWLRKEIFPGADKWLKESEKRMLRLQVCLLVSLGKAPDSIQRSWGISKSVFRYILVDLLGLFEGPISIEGDKAMGISSTPVSPAKLQPHSRMGVVTNLQYHANPSSVQKGTGSTSKDDSSSPDAESSTDLTEARSTPLADRDSDFFIEEDSTAPDDEEIPFSIARPTKSSLRKTVASVLSPLKAARSMARGRTSTDRDTAKTSVELLQGPSDKEAEAEAEENGNAGDAYLEGITPAIATTCGDDGEVIEVTLDDGENPTSNGDKPSAGGATKVIRIYLDHILAPSTAGVVDECRDERVFSELDLLRQDFEKGDRQAYAIEIQTSEDCPNIKFCQVFPSENLEDFEQNAERYGWLDHILKASVSSQDPSEAAAYMMACLGHKHPKAFAAAAEDLGYMKVVGPEI